jgi:hypothetical protein
MYLGIPRIPEILSTSFRTTLSFRVQRSCRQISNPSASNDRTALRNTSSIISILSISKLPIPCRDEECNAGSILLSLSLSLCLLRCIRRKEAHDFTSDSSEDETAFTAAGSDDVHPA